MQKTATWANLIQVLVSLAVLLVGAGWAFLLRVNRLEWQMAEEAKKAEMVADMNIRLARIETKIDMAFLPKGR